MEELPIEEKPAPKRKIDDIFIIFATLVQGVVAALALIDYIYAKVANILGSTKVDLIIIWGFGIAGMFAFALLIFRREKMSLSQISLVRVIATIGIVAAIVYIILSNENRYSRFIVEPVGIEKMPFLLLKSYGFEGSREGWDVFEESAPVELSIENKSNEAYDGRGYLRLRTNLPGTPSHNIELNQISVLESNNNDVIRFIEVVSAYVKIFPSEQTIDNQFYAEIQVHTYSDNENFWSKARYTLETGEWQPIVWTRPSMIVKTGEEDDELAISYFGDIVDIYIMIFSDEPFIGQIGIDNVNFYRVQRP